MTAFSTTHKDEHFFRRLVLRNFSVAVLIEFVVNLHTFPLLAELALMPTVLLLVMTHAYSQLQARRDPALRQAEKALGVFLSIVGVVALAFALKYVARNFDEVATRETVREFVLPVLLTAGFIPFLYALGLTSVYQTTLAMIRFGMKGNDVLYRSARRQIVRACGVSLAKAQLFESKFRGRLFGATDDADVSRVLTEFRAATSSRGRS